MKLLIENVQILTMVDGQLPFMGSIGVEDDRICFIGVTPETFNPDKTIDGDHLLAMPGFVNAHTHMGMSLLRNYADDLPLMTWLNEKIWPVEAKLSAEDIYYGSLLSMAELIRTGCTTFRDMYFQIDEVAKATDLSGLRANLGQGLVGFSDPDELAFAQVREIYKNWHEKADGRIHIEVAPHAPYTCSNAYLTKAKELALELRVPLHIHLSESVQEVKDCVENYQKTPIALMESIGLFEAKVSAAHCVHLQAQDFDILRRNEVSVLYNPSSNLKLGNGFAKISNMLQSGINVALGTDGASSNNNLNMLEEIHLGALVNKGIEGDPTVLPAYQMLKIATINGAKALGIDKEVGSLEVGKKADLVLFDLNKSHLVPHHNLVSLVVYSAAASDVKYVICNGKILLDNYEITTFDENEVIKKVKQLSVDLLKRVSE
ncbi:amidohydrolase [Fusibacter bizertensis]